MSRSDATIVIMCDGENCFAEWEVGLTPLAGYAWDERNVAAQLRYAGWTRRDRDDFCPACSAPQDEETQP